MDIRKIKSIFLGLVLTSSAVFMIVSIGMRLSATNRLSEIVIKKDANMRDVGNYDGIVQKPTTSLVSRLTVTHTNQIMEPSEYSSDSNDRSAHDRISTLQDLSDQDPGDRDLNPDPKDELDPDQDSSDYDSYSYAESSVEEMYSDADHDSWIAELLEFNPVGNDTDDVRAPLWDTGLTDQNVPASTERTVIIHEAVIQTPDVKQYMQKQRENTETRKRVIPNNKREQKEPMKPFSDDEFLKLKRNGTLEWNIPSDLFNTAPEVFLNTPTKFLSKTKSPCWYERTSDDRRLRCLPYYYLIGMPKCGTTDLYSKISNHPSVVKLQKEPHWWTRRRFGQGNRRKEHFLGASYEDYLDHFNPLTKAIQTQHKARRLISGDGTASTMWYSTNVTRKQGVVQSNPLPVLFRVLQPNVKLIAMLREPVERLYSDYLYFQHSDVSPKRFHKLVLEGIALYKQCTATQSIRRCINKNTNAQKARITLGLYSVLLADWFKVFPRDQIMIIRLRDWNADCENLLPKVYKFLNLERLSKGPIRKICGEKKINVNTRRRKVPMLNETKELLTKFYRPYNEELVALMGDKRYFWLE